VIRVRFAAAARLICVLTAITAVGVPAPTSAATRTTTTRKTVSTPKASKPAVRKTTTASKATKSTARSRRVRAARARAAQQAAVLRDALEPRFKFDETGLGFSSAGAAASANAK